MREKASNTSDLGGERWAEYEDGRSGESINKVKERAETGGDGGRI